MSEAKQIDDSRTDSTTSAFQRTSFAQCPNGHLVINGPRAKHHAPEPDGHGNRRVCYHCGECEASTTVVAARHGSDVADPDWDFEPLVWYALTANTTSAAPGHDVAAVALATSRAHAMSVALEYVPLGNDVMDMSVHELPDEDNDIHGVGKRVTTSEFRAAVTPVGDFITEDDLTKLAREYTDEELYLLE